MGRESKTRRSAKISLRAGIKSDVLFPRLLAQGGDNLAVFLAYAARDAESGRLKVRQASLDALTTTAKSKPVRDRHALARMIQGISHADRIAIAEQLAAGPQTHQSLRTALGLAPGPLYHHLRTLERAGLVCSPRRNQYELSPSGQLVLAMVAGLQVLVEAPRRAGPWKTRNIRPPGKLKSKVS